MYINTQNFPWAMVKFDAYKEICIVLYCIVL